MPEQSDPVTDECGCNHEFCRAAAAHPDTPGFFAVQNAIEDAILSREVEPPADLADLIYVATEAVMPFIRTGQARGLPVIH